jgi:hypothetical protein
MDFMRSNNQPGWGYYLGTPSGNLLKWTDENGVEDLP